MNCKNCGHSSNEPRICPHCGHVAAYPGNRAAAVAFFICLVLPCAGVGACIVDDLSRYSRQESSFYSIAFGVPILIALIGLLLCVRKLWRG